MTFFTFIAALLGSLTAVVALFLVFPRETLKAFFWLKLQLNRLLPSWFPADQRPWFWKGVGGSIGYVIGGPLGLVAGVVFGHSLARPTKEGSLGEQLVRELTESEKPEHLKLELDEAQAVFFLTAFAMLSKLTEIDEHGSPEDIDAVRRFMNDRLDLDAERRKLAVDIFQASRESESTYVDYAQQFYQIFRFAPEVLEQMLDVLLTVAKTDPRLREEEEKLLQATAIIFDLDQDRIARLRAHHNRGFKDPYAILGCTIDDPPPLIAEKYRRLSLSYNPERVVSQGVSSEFLRVADHRFREIQLAFDQIVREHEGS